jgi:ribonuclease HI
VATVVYTDGACSGNPGPGGWAWAVGGGPFASGAEAHTTNQRMEIMAAYSAVLTLPGTLEVVSDSTYVVNCFRDRWWEGWMRRGWLNSQRKPVANRDLWEPFVDLVRERRDVSFRWVKGHSGDPMNDMVDRLAVEACVTQEGRTGDGDPGDLGPADEVRAFVADVIEGAPPGPAAARAALAATAEPPFAGRAVAVLGHRPPELGGYDDNPVADAVRSKLAEILEAKAAMDDELVVLSGLRLGAEMLGAEAAVGLGLPLVAVLPYPDPESVWPAASQARFRELRDQAAEVVLLQRKAPASKQQAGAALARRDAWIARHAAEAVLVWDGRDESLGKLFRSLEDRLGDDVWVLDPNALA